MVTLLNECMLYNNSIELVRCVQCEHEIIVFVLARNVASAPNKFMQCAYSKDLADIWHRIVLINRMLLECSQLCRRDI